jgi:hypothetical protein
MHNYRARQVDKLTDCESVENRDFAGLLGSPVCQLCARFRAIEVAVEMYQSPSF